MNDFGVYLPKSAPMDNYMLHYQEQAYLTMKATIIDPKNSQETFLNTNRKYSTNFFFMNHKAEVFLYFLHTIIKKNLVPRFY